MGFFDWLNKKEQSIEEVCIKRDSDFSNFKKVTDFIYEESGITDLDKRALTSSRAQQYAITQDIYTTDEFLLQMKNSHEFYQEIINIATVNETFFLREVKELEWLVEYIKKENRAIKILSMPCSSGEEIYSILIMLSLRGIDLSTITITGYDINSQAVKLASQAKYDEHSLHKIDTQTRDKYFTLDSGSLYEVIDSLKNIPKFEQKNIFDITDIAKYDVVLSRNMFIYFDEDKRKIATDIVANLLKSGGIYIKGHADHIYKHPKLDKLAYGIYTKLN